MLLPNRTKIVATLGPASDSDEVLAQLIRAGTNVFRINCSHSDHAGIVERIRLVRRVASACNAQIGVLADLQGPKIRIGRLKNEEPIWLKPDAPLIIVSDKTVVGEDAKPGEVIRVGTSYELLCKDVKVGERILIDDGNLEVVVDKVVGRDVHTTVVYGGLLKQYKGINLPGTDVSADILTEKDLGDLKVALEHNADFVALSFVRRAGDLRLLGKYIREANSNARMISKIERPEAIENLEHHRRVVRRDGGTRGHGRGARCRGSTIAAEADDQAITRRQQAGDHGDADAGIHDHEPASYSRGGFGCRQRHL